MKYFNIAILILLLYLGIEGLVFWYRVNHLPALPDIVQKNQTLGQGPGLKYIAAGDSTAVGEGASEVSKTYTYRVAEYLSNKHKVEYKNIATIGATTKDVVEKQLSEIVASQPDVVTVSIGANDITHWVSGDEILDNYQTIIEKLTNETQARIYIANIPGLENAQLLPWVYRNYLDRRSIQLNQEIIGFETDRVRFIDIHDFGWSRFPDIQTTFAADHFHPNDLGYTNWTDAFLDQIHKDF